MKIKSNVQNEDKLGILRHSTAHVLAVAVLEMFPEAKFGIGPAIEDGFYYDFDLPRTLIPEDLPILEEKMQEIIKTNYPFEKTSTYAKKAIELFSAYGGSAAGGKKAKQPYKVELIKELSVPSLRGARRATKQSRSSTVTLYKTGNFVDLCAGPHIDSTGEIKSDAFKLLKISGAYWKGSEKNKMLQRIYGTVFETKKELHDYLKKLEEAEKRDHRKLGKDLDLFMTSEEVGKGLIMYLPRGAFIRRQLENYMYEKEFRYGYQFVMTPVLAREEMYKKSGHLDHYHEDMYSPIDIEGENYYLKPMNCPHHHLMYKHSLKSYRDLPIRFSDFGTIHRYERSGVLTGLIRARSFSQNDAHIYCSKEQIKDEFIRVLRLFDEVYKDFRITDYWFRLSLPDYKNKEKYGDIKNKDMWEYSAEVARKAMREHGAKFEEVEGEAAFYGPKIDVQTKNVLGKEDTIATIQVDFYMPARFGLTFINQKGKEETPIVIHRAIMGSFDRFMAFLLEKTAGNLPLWLSPVQVEVIPVSDKFKDYGQKINSLLTEKNIRSQIHESDETLGKRIREAQQQKINYMLIVGEKEKAANSVAVRHREKGDLGMMKMDEFIKKIIKEIESKK